MPTNTVFSNIMSNLHIDGLLWWMLFGLAILFIAHAVVAAYHWYSYGSERSVSLLSIGIYTSVGSVLLIMMAITLLTL